MKKTESLKKLANWAFTLAARMLEKTNSAGPLVITRKGGKRNIYLLPFDSEEEKVAMLRAL